MTIKLWARLALFQDNWPRVGCCRASSGQRLGWLDLADFGGTANPGNPIGVLEKHVQTGLPVLDKYCIQIVTMLR